MPHDFFQPNSVFANELATSRFHFNKIRYSGICAKRCTEENRPAFAVSPILKLKILFCNCIRNVKTDISDVVFDTCFQLSVSNMFILSFV